ncbi:MAG: vitamin B12 dependent-methionine synthase activation domain-containing protein [bacterium]
MSESNHPEIYHFTPTFSDLVIHRPLIERALGYKSGSVPQIVEHIIDEVLPDVPQHLSIQCGFRILPPGTLSISKQAIEFNGTRFETAPIISTRLRNSLSLALFVATIGPRLEQWSRQHLDEGDSVRGFIIDAIGSEAVEQTADWLEKQLQQIVKERGWNSTNRYSPGYCDWMVIEQHKLFSLLPPDFCGIRLTESALMVPIKSVSGFIGLGPDVKKEEYQCSICDLQDCFRRREESTIEAPTI